LSKGIKFVWHSKKAETNLKKHKVSFEEASTIFGDILSITIADILHPAEEERFITIGESVKGRLVVVVHSDFNDTIRIISARLATKKEIKKYEEDK